MCRSGDSPSTRSTVALAIVFLCSSAVLVGSSSVVELSLTNAGVSGGLWVTDNQTEVAAQNELVVKITGIPPSSDFGVVHVHSFPPHSYIQVKPPHNATTITGPDVGFVHPSALGPAVFTVSNPFQWTVQVMLVVRLYDKSYPVPGGCALEFPTKVAPYLIVENGNETISVKGQKAAVAVNDQLCMGNDLEYEFYYTYTSEKIETASDHFAHLRAMLNYSELTNEAYRAYWMGGSPTQRLFAKYPGVCTYYAMAVRGPLDKVALYSPSSSMLCGPDTWLGSTLGMKVYVGLLLPIGIILCFAGHSMFPASIFFTSFLAGHHLSYVGLTASGVPPDDAWNYGVLVAVIIAAIMLIVVVAIYSPLFLLAIPIMCAAYLFWATVFYLTSGNVLQFTEGPAFWTMLVAIVLGLSVLMYVVPQVGCIASLAFIGSFLIVDVIDYILGFHIKNVTINPIRRFTVQGFESAITTPPLETSDILLFGLWMALAVFGFEKQRRRSLGRAPFPPPPRLPSFTRSSDERRPLLPDADDKNRQGQRI